MHRVGSVLTHKDSTFFMKTLEFLVQLGPFLLLSLNNIKVVHSDPQIGTDNSLIGFFVV